MAHPKTGNPVRKVFHSPNVSSKYTEASTKSKLTDENVEKHGFTRYEKDKLTGRYNKTAGKDKRAPDVVDANQLKKIHMPYPATSCTANVFNNRSDRLYVFVLKNF